MVRVLAGGGGAGKTCPRTRAAVPDGKRERRDSDQRSGAGNALLAV